MVGLLGITGSGIKGGPSDAALFPTLAKANVHTIAPNTEIETFFLFDAYFKFRSDIDIPISITDTSIAS